MNVRHLLAPALLLWAGAAAGAPRPAAARGDVGAAVRRVFPALVRIHVVVSTFEDGREQRQEAAGSGVIVSPAGHVVTNHHVAGRARKVVCTLSDRREVDAVLVGSDPLSDIAVLRLDPAGAPYPSASWGDPDRLRVGDPVLAMGSPLALSQSVTRGIVSNTAMTLPQLFTSRGFELDGEDVGSLVRWIGHDAQIFPGNSGGPLVNLAGEVVGVNEISLGLGGAIPADLARAVADELVRRGEVRRSWLGLEVQPLLRGTGDRGALVSSVAAGSPAAAAGLRPGDVLLSYRGQPVTVRWDEELPAFQRRVLETPIGAAVELGWRRDGREHRARAATVDRGPARAEEAELEPLGLTARDLSLLDARELRREPGSGVRVTGVRAGAPAAEAKPALAEGDVVVAVGGTPVRRVEDVAARVAAVSAGRDRAPVLIAFERKGQALLTVVRVRAGRDGDRSISARRASLEVKTQVLTADLAEALGLAGRRGVRVTQVQPGSTAEAAGLRAGDVLLRLDGQEIPAASAEDAEVFAAMIRPYPVGAAVRLEGVRGAAPLAVEAELVASAPSARELAEYRDARLDFAARDLTVQDRLAAMMDRAQVGALVTRVEPGGWAALAHLSVGDVVVAVDGAPVDGARALRERLERAAEQRPARIVLLVVRGTRTRFLELAPVWPAPGAGTGRGS